MDASADVILRYLDRQTTPEEEAGLARELRASRDARRRFARLSRIHGNLAGVLSETAREWTSSPAPAPTLADLSADLIATALRLRASGDPGDPELLRSHLEEKLRAFDGPGFRPEDLRDAKYALVAFLDETIMSTPLKDSWSPLQLALFNELSAGEGFYDRIESLRREKNAAVLEVYYLCLALGFSGKWRDLAGIERKKLLLDDLLREIRAAAPVSGLSPHWRPPDSALAFSRRVPAWTAVAACGLFVAVLYVFLSSWLSVSANALLDRLK